MTLLCSGIWGRYEVCCLSNEHLLTGIPSSSQSFCVALRLFPFVQSYHLHHLYISHYPFPFCLCTFKNVRICEILKLCFYADFGDLNLGISACVGSHYLLNHVSCPRLTHLFYRQYWSRTAHSGMFQNCSIARKLFLEQTLAKVFGCNTDACL